MKQLFGQGFSGGSGLVGLAAAVFACLLIPETGFASPSPEPHGPISWSFIVIGLLGGLALFLYGLEKMSKGLKDSTGSQMRRILGALTRNRMIGFLVGGFVTMVIQSSSATTVMLVSFVQAGLMTFVQSLGVILGADVGSTVTAQLIAFKLTDYALIMVAAGVGARMFSRRRIVMAMGEILLGFGILFYGMKLMSDAMAPLRTWPEFITLLQGLENPLLGILAGGAFTALIQSSGAFTGILIVLAQENLITLEAGIPMVLGANVGTCVTAILASIGMTREAKRVAMGHVLFKVAGVMLFVFWIPEFAAMVRDLTTHFGAGMARQIANAHTLFNVSVGLVFLPFTTVFARLIQKVFPDRKKEQITRELTIWYLDESSIKTPEIAISLARTELSRMAKLLERMLRAIIIPFISDEQHVAKGVKEREEAELLRREIPKRDAIFSELTLMEGIDMREAKIDFLEEKIGDFLNRVLREGVSKESVSEVFGMMSIAKDMESIGDLIHRNMVPLITKKKALHADFSDEGKEELMIYHNKVCTHIRLLKEAFAETNRDKACQIMSQERTYLDLESRFRLKHLERVHCEQQESQVTHGIHMELMDLLKQIVVYSSNIAATFSNTCAITRPQAAASAEPAPVPGAIFQEGPSSS